MCRYCFPQPIFARSSRTNSIIVNRTEGGGSGKKSFFNKYLSRTCENDDLRNTINYVLCLGPRTAKHSPNISIKSNSFATFSIPAEFHSLLNDKLIDSRGVKRMPRHRLSYSAVHCLMCCLHLEGNFPPPVAVLHTYQDVIESNIVSKRQVNSRKGLRKSSIKFES